MRILCHRRWLSDLLTGHRSNTSWLRLVTFSELIKLAAINGNILARLQKSAWGMVFSNFNVIENNWSAVRSSPIFGYGWITENIGSYWILFPAKWLGPPPFAEYWLHWQIGDPKPLGGLVGFLDAGCRCGGGKIVKFARRSDVKVPEFGDWVAEWVAGALAWWS